MKVLGVKNGDIVEVEVREGEAVIRPVKSTDKSTLEILKILKETKAYGGYEDFLKSIIMRMLMDSYKNIFIDTQLWVYAFKQPLRKGLWVKKEYEDALKIHGKARVFLYEAFTKHTLYITTHQLAELYHALAFRGIRMNAREALAIIEKIMSSTRTVVVEVKRRHYR